MSATRFPLSWPIGWKRTPARQRRRAAFKSFGRALSVHDATGRLAEQCRLLGASGEILSTNFALRLDGRPRSDQSEPIDPGAAVYFRLPSATTDTCFACDKWDRVADNIAAIAAHIECLRGIDRYGIGTLDQAFAGYAALPPSPIDWWLILDVPRDAAPEAVKDAFRGLAMKLNRPVDLGGDPERMAQVNLAMDAWEELQRGQG